MTISAMLKPSLRAHVENVQFVESCQMLQQIMDDRDTCMQAKLGYWEKDEHTKDQASSRKKHRYEAASPSGTMVQLTWIE